MRRRAIALVEVLATGAILGAVVLTIVGTFAPRGQSSGAGPKAVDSTCLNNLNGLATAFALYVLDWDDRYPMAFTVESKTNRWRSGYPRNIEDLCPIPPDWRWSQSSDQHEVNYTHWANSVFPYCSSWGEYECPEGPKRTRTAEGAPKSEYEEPWIQPRNSSYTFNGLLHTYAQSGVVSPAKLPLIWEGLGKVRIVGFAMSNPILNCTSTTEECMYRYLSDKPSGRMFGSLASPTYPGESNGSMAAVCTSRSQTRTQDGARLVR